MNKKVLSLFLAVFTLISLVVPVTSNAENISTLKPNMSREDIIKQDEIAAQNGDDKLISSFKVNEYDAFMNLKSKSEVELKELGLDSEEIQEIQEYDPDEIIMELKNKSDRELMEIGYTEERINLIRTYDGSENSIQGAFSDLYCDIYLNRHEYDSADRRTTFRVRFDWEWEDMPVITRTDIIGAIVSEGMYYDDYSSYHIIYYYTWDSYDDEYYYIGSNVYDFNPTDEIHCIETTFDLFAGYPYELAMEGRAYCSFSKSGRVPEAAMVIQYGHTFYGITEPSVSVGPGSLGLSFLPKRNIEVMNQDSNYYIHSTDYGNRVDID